MPRTDTWSMEHHEGCQHLNLGLVLMILVQKAGGEIVLTAEDRDRLTAVSPPVTGEHEGHHLVLWYDELKPGSASLLLRLVSFDEVVAMNARAEGKLQ